MNVDILGNAERYLFFNERNEVLCGSCTGFNKPRNRARVVYLDYRDTPFPANANGHVPLHVEVDGVYVRFGRAKCGVHDRSYNLGTFRVGASLITGDRPLDFDALRRSYVEQRDAQQNRDEKHLADYVAALRRTAEMAEDQFTIERREGTPRHPEGEHGAEATIYGPTGYGGDPAPVSRVSLDNDHGVWGVWSVDFSGHTGRGRGSPALARIIGRLLIEMADKADALNREATRG